MPYWPGARIRKGLSSFVGGALLYAQLLEHCSDLFLSRVRGKPQGDAFFPPFEHLFDSGQVLLEAPEFSVTHHRALVP